MTYDHDPYAIATETGRIFWILDAYTTTDKYPYSERYVLGQDSDTSGQAARAFFGGQQVRQKAINYIRNSMKAVIDTYTGGYYMIMRLPERTQEEFLLMVPFTPDNKSNTIAWMCAQCNGPDYGRLLVHKFPKEKLIYGPRQVEARIDQQTKISRELTLWGQQGSDVVRGDLLVIPIEESLLYIEPVYIVATDKSSLPELKRVIVVYGEKVEMGKSLTRALEKVFDIQDTGLSFSLDAEVGHAQTDDDSVIDLARRVTQYFQAAQGSIQKGDWVEYGQYQERLEEAIRDLSAALELKEE